MQGENIMKKVFILSLIFIILSITVSCSTETKIAASRIILEDAINRSEGFIAGELTRLQNIAESGIAKEGDWENILNALKDDPEKIAALYWYALPDGSYYTSERGKVKANLSDRAYFPTLLAGKDVVGYPIIGKTSGKKSFVIAVPVIKDGEVTGIVASSIYLDEFWNRIKANITIPENMDFYAVNSQGIAMFDFEKRDYCLINVFELDSYTLTDAVKKIIASDKGYVEYEWNDKVKIAVYEKSEISDWHYVLSFY